MKFSAVINCFNEEDFIFYAMKSIYPYCDEIVVVDNCSTDNTVECVMKFISNDDNQNKVKPFFLETPKQLADARNFAMDMASHDWIIKWDGDFCAYGESDVNKSNVRPFSELIDFIKKQDLNFIDIFLLYSINICGDFLHYDKTRQYLGLSGDSFIGKKNCIRYAANEKYGDVGLLFRPDGSKAKLFYLNKPEINPMYFVHLYGIKPDEYLLYRRFLSEYQIWISNNNFIEFWDWFNNVKKNNLDSGIGYIRKKLVENLERHNISLPNILNPLIEKMDFQVIYDDKGLPSDRIYKNK